MTQHHTVTTVQRPTGYRVFVDGRPAGIVGKGTGDYRMIGTSWYGVTIDGTRYQSQGRGPSHFTAEQAIHHVAEHYLTHRAAA